MNYQLSLAIILGFLGLAALTLFTINRYYLFIDDPKIKKMKNNRKENLNSVKQEVND